VKDVIDLKRIFSRIAVLIIGIILITGCEKSRVEEGSFSLTTLVDTTGGTIGDVFNITLTAKPLQGKFLTVEQPEFKDSLSLAYWRMGTEQGDSIRIQYGVAVWDTGKTLIPPIGIRVMNSDSSEAFHLESDPVRVNVQSVLNAAQDQSIRPLKDPVPIPKKFPLRSLGFLILLAIIIALMIMIWRKRIYGAVRPLKMVPLQLPPDKVAYQKLAEADDLLERDIRQFYVHLSYLLREYIERSFYYKTLEMTAGEIRKIAEKLPIPEEDIMPVLDVLERADFIKFARRIPHFEEGKRDLDIAADFLRRTIPLFPFGKLKFPHRRISVFTQLFYLGWNLM